MSLESSHNQYEFQPECTQVEPENSEIYRSIRLQPFHLQQRNYLTPPPSRDLIMVNLEAIENAIHETTNLLSRLQVHSTLLPQYVHER